MKDEHMQSALEQPDMTVIVRSYGSKPVRFRAILGPTCLRIFGRDGQSMGWPYWLAVSDDPGRFDALESAWKSGDESVIEEAWNRASKLRRSTHE